MLHAFLLAGAWLASPPAGATEVARGGAMPEAARPAIARDARFSAAARRSLTLAMADIDGRAPREDTLAHGRDISMPPVANGARAPRRMHGITVPIPPASAAIALPPVQGPRGSDRPLVVIDAGHGGHDPGAINGATGQREKDVTLAIAQAIRDALLRSGRIRVALTRDDDRFLVLQERYGIARRLGADLFLSIHADSADNGDAHGATVYTLSETASDREAARLAARENKADIINGIDLGGQSSDVSSILIDLTQRETMALSADFARLLQREASPFVPFRTTSHRFASLIVLKAPDTPSVLFETGYISNDADAAFLTSREGQHRIAQGVARAVEVHFARRLAAAE
jgi:N-acetylmuramoyl-L-alanine amidase